MNVFMGLKKINIDKPYSNAIDSKKQENSFHYSPVLLKRTVSFGEFNQGGFTMPGMNGIYRINPALLGGICGGCTGLILYLIYSLIFKV